MREDARSVPDSRRARRSRPAELAQPPVARLETRSTVVACVRRTWSTTSRTQSTFVRDQRLPIEPRHPAADRGLGLRVVEPDLGVLAVAMEADQQRRGP